MRPSRRIAAALLATCAFVLIAVTHAHAAYKNPIGGNSNSSSPVCYSHWQSVGPFSVDPGTDLGRPAGIGAVSGYFHSTSNLEAFVGTAHGGVWRTSVTTHSFAGAHWEAVTDHMPCSSISVIAGSIDDGKVVAAGCGLDSSGDRRDGEPMGVMITIDRGNTWTMTSFPKGYDVSAIVIRGGVINPSNPVQLVVAARAAVEVRSGSAGTTTNPYNVTGGMEGGIWHSPDGGATFSRAHTGSVSDLTLSTDGLTLYASALVARDTTNGWPASLLQSSDGGATWAAVAPAFSSELDALCDTTGLQPSLVNARLSASPQDVSIYAGFVIDADVSGQPCYAFGFFDGTAWAPSTAAPTGALSLSTPGDRHLAIAAVIDIPGVLFAAGSSRAVYSFSRDTSQWTLLSAPFVDSTTAGATKSNTAPGPRATSLTCELVGSDDTTALFNLRLGTSSGIFERYAQLIIDPSEFVYGQHDWESQSGDLVIAEAYQAAVDPATGAIAIGTHSNGVMISQLSGTEQNNGSWSALLRTDATSVGVDTSVSPASFYASASYLSEMFRVAVNGGGAKEAFTQAFPAVGGSTPCDLGSSSCFVPHTFLAVNSANTTKVLVCTVERCYAASFGPPSQSLVALELAISPSGSLRSYVYGGRRNGVSNEHVVFAVGRSGVWARDVDTCASDGCVTRYPGTSCTGACILSNSFNTNPPWYNAITRAQPAQHPQDYYVNVVIDDAGHSWLTADFGQSWIDLNDPAKSNLLALSGHTSVDTFHTGAAIFVDVSVNGVQPLIIATPNGAFVSFNQSTATFFTFVRLGAHWARAVPSGLTYSAATDTLSLASFGRGVWQLQAASLVLAQAARGETTTTLNSNCTVPLYPNVPGMFGYTTGPTPEPIGFPDPVVPVPSSSSTGAAEPSSSTGDASASSTGIESSSSGGAPSSTGASPSSTGTADASSSTGGTSPSTGDASSSSGSGGVDSSSTGETPAPSSSTGGGSDFSSSGATASGDDSSSGSTGAETSSSGDQPGTDSSSTGEAGPSADSSSGADSDSSTGGADSTAEPTPDESSSSASEWDSSTADEQPTDGSSTGSDPDPGTDSSTAEASPDSSTGEPEPEPEPDNPDLQVQFRMVYSLDALPDGMDVAAFSAAVQAALNRLLGVTDRVWVVSVAPGSVVVTVAIYPRSSDTDHVPSDRLQSDLIGLVNTVDSPLHQDPLMSKAEIGSAQPYVAPRDQSSSSSSTGGAAPYPRDDGSRLPQAGSNDRGSDLGIGIGVGIGVLVLVTIGCVGLHVKAKREYEARKNALIDSTAEMI